MILDRFELTALCELESLQCLAVAEDMLLDDLHARRNSQLLQPRLPEAALSQLFQTFVELCFLEALAEAECALRQHPYR